VEWEKKRLKFVAPLRNARADANSEHADYLGLENIQSWTGKLLLNATREQVADEDAAGGTANRFCKDDVLFGKLRPYLAKALHADRDGVCTTELLVMTHQPDIYPRYLLYTFLSQDFVGQVDASTFGSKMPRANWKYIGSMKVPVPSLDTQRCVADFLDQETARIDALVEEKERMLALLEEKRAALIGRAVTRGVGLNASLKPSGLDWTDEIPTHWKTCQLKRTWKSSDYGISESIRDEGEIAVLRMSCIVDGRIVLDKSGMISEVDEALWLRRDDLLFNRTNSLDQIAKVGLVDFDPIEPLTFASYLVRLRVNHRVIPGYLVYLLNSADFLMFARKNAIPAIGQANLSPTRYGEIRIPLPPIDEQRQIVNLLDADAKRSDALRLELARSIDLLKHRRAALIAAAVTGNIPMGEMAV
jgi:type I restriction enzyme S subunit